MAFKREKALSAASRAIEKKQYKKALSYYKNICKDDPADVKSRLFLGDLYSRTGDRTNCLKSYADVAHAYVNDGQLLKAVAVYSHMLQVDGGLHVIHVALARVYDQMGLVKDAVSQYREALAVLAHRDQQLSRLHVIKELLDLDPENIRARVRLAEDFLAEGAVEDGIRELRAAAYLLDDAERVDDFLAVADRLLYHSPEDANIARRVAALHMEREAPQHALFRLQACYRANPCDTEVLSMLGTCFSQLGQGHKALTVLRELARIHDRNGLITERNEALVRVLEIDPADLSARRVLQGRVADAPVEEELGFDELAFDAAEEAEESRGFGDESSFSGSDSFIAPEASVSQVEFDDLDALAALVAGEPLSASSLHDLMPSSDSEDSQPNGGQAQEGNAFTGEELDSTGGSPIVNNDEVGGLGNERSLSVEPAIGAALSADAISVDEMDIGSDVIDLPSSSVKDLKPQTVASLEDLVAIVASLSDGAPSLPLDHDLESLDNLSVVSSAGSESGDDPTAAAVVVEDIADVTNNNLVDDEISALTRGLDEDWKEQHPDDSNLEKSLDNGHERTQEEGEVLAFRTELREWDFYIDNGFKDEARDLLEELMRTHGEHAELLVRRTRLEELDE